jgi:hypothetical protein
MSFPPRVNSSRSFRSGNDQHRDKRTGRPDDGRALHEPAPSPERDAPCRNPPTVGPGRRGPSRGRRSPGIPLFKCKVDYGRCAVADNVRRILPHAGSESKEILFGGAGACGTDTLSSRTGPLRPRPAALSRGRAASPAPGRPRGRFARPARLPGAGSPAAPHGGASATRASVCSRWTACFARRLSSSKS